MYFNEQDSLFAVLDGTAERVFASLELAYWVVFDELNLGLQSEIVVPFQVEDVVEVARARFELFVAGAESNKVRIALKEAVQVFETNGVHSVQHLLKSLAVAGHASISILFVIIRNDGERKLGVAGNDEVAY